MLNHVGRKLTLSVFKTTRSLCSSPAASDNSFTVSYLIDSCGFPPEKAISASRYLKFKTPDRADSVLSFFKHQGFTEIQSRKLVQNFPLALTCHPQKNLLPKFDFLSSTGLSGSDILKLFTARPQLLGRSLKNYIEPNYNSLRDMLQSNDRTLVAIRRCAWALDRDFQANPWCMVESEEKMDKVMDYLVNTMGFDTSTIVKNSVFFTYSLEKRIIPRCLVYQYCLDNGLMNDKNYCGYSCWLQCSEDIFVKRLKRFEKEGPGVLKFYQEKLDLAN